MCFGKVPGMDVYEDLKRRLVSGDFTYGEKLRAEGLRNDYGCSASTIREALLRLSAVGLVDFQEQRGFRMPQYSRRRQHEVTEMRILLEQEGACRSIRNSTVDWEARLNAAHHKLSHIEKRIAAKGPKDGLPELWMEAELEFHGTLLSACGSEALIETHLVIYHQYRQIKVEFDRRFEHLADNIREHQAIVDAALSGDEPGMRKSILEHFERHLVSAKDLEAEHEIPLVS